MITTYNIDRAGTVELETAMSYEPTPNEVVEFEEATDFYDPVTPDLIQVAVRYDPVTPDLIQVAVSYYPVTPDLIQVVDRYDTVTPDLIQVFVRYDIVTPGVTLG